MSSPRPLLCLALLTGCVAEAPGAAEAVGEGLSLPPAVPAAAVKPPRRWAFTLVETDGPGALDKQRAQDLLFSDRPESIRSYYREVSYGLQDLAGDVIGPMTYDATSVPSGLCVGYGTVGAALRPGIGKYDQYLFYFENEIKNCNWGGVAQLGMSARPSVDSYYNASSDCVVLIQEPGHNFGMVHSSAARCTRGGVPVSIGDTDDPEVICKHDEYGNPFDPMGGGPYVPGARPTLCYHMNGVQKAYEEWLDGCNIVKATKSGLFTIYPLEKPNRELQVLQVPLLVGRAMKFTAGTLVVKVGSVVAYYLEMRAPVGLDAALDRPRLFVVAAGNLREARARGNPNWLLDMTPETPTLDDADLPVGKTFEDPAPNGPKITLVSLDETKAVVRVELTGVAAETRGEGTCLDDQPYIPGKVRIPDAGPDFIDSPDPDPLPPRQGKVKVNACALGGGAGAPVGWLLAIVAGVGGCRRRRRR
jgi:hypothetical protein